MGVYKEQLDRGRTRDRTGWRRWAKNQLNRLMRRQARFNPDAAPKKLGHQGYET